MNMAPSTRRRGACGWFDAVRVRYTARLSGVDELAHHALGRAQCAAGDQDLHRVRDRRPAGDRFPATSTDLRRAVPVYETLPGWRQEIAETRRLDDLPPAAREYLDRLSGLIGAPGVLCFGRAGTATDNIRPVAEHGRRRVNTL